MQLAFRFGSATSLRFCVLGSGSSGNSIVFDCDGQRLLVDAGFSCRELERRLKGVGLEPNGFAGIVLTHEHGDHVRGAKRFARRHGVPIVATEGTLRGASLYHALPRTISLTPGRPHQLRSFRLEPFAVPHDAREPIGLVVESESGHRVAVIADVGRRTASLWKNLHSVDALILEANHDVEMLRSGPYPWRLKQRIAGGRGHLSNEEAGRGIRELLDGRLRTVVLYHLSKINNLPILAEEAVVAELERAGANIDLHVSGQDEPTPWVEFGIEEAAATAGG